MPLEIGQSCTWNDRVAKGAAAQLAVLSAHIEISHGVTPAIGRLVVVPQPDPRTGEPLAPAVGMVGDLVFTDEVHGEVRLRDCRIFRVTGERTGEGTTYTIMIEDRRWRWHGAASGVAYGGMVGHYNRPDARGKLIPWAIRSPEEIARTCLEALGEVGYVINLPAGLPRSAGADLDHYLRLGENFPPSGTNPEIVADHTPPADVLARLCDLFGCRVVYQHVTDRILIAPLGVGTPLPDGLPIELTTLGITAPETPAATAVAGAPIRWQTRFLLEAVGLEWDGLVCPINDLSYAPLTAGATQRSTVAPKSGATPTSLQVQLNWEDAAGGTWTVVASDTDSSAVAMVVAVMNTLRSNSAAAAVFEFSTVGTTLRIDGRTAGMGFRVYAWETTEPEGESAAWDTAVTQEPAAPGPSWESCDVESFLNVRPTDRLSYREANNLARQSIWRMYRVKLVNPDTGKPPFTLPVFGTVDRVHQIELLPTKVSQVVPAPRFDTGVDVGNPLPGNPFATPGRLPEFYNGVSRDARATVHGSVCKFLEGSQAVWVDYADKNTAPTERVPVGFQLANDDGGNQYIVFDSPVFFWDPVLTSTGVRGGFYREPKLTLETSCVVRGAESDVPVRYEQLLTLGGAAPVEWADRPDLQVGIVASDLGNATAAVPGVVTVTYTGGSASPAALQVTINWTKGGSPYGPAVLGSSQNPGTVAALWSQIAAQAAALTGATAPFAPNFTVSAAGNVLTIKGKSGFPFTVGVSDTTNYRVNVAVEGREPANPLAPGAWRYGTGDLEYALPASRAYLEGMARKYRLSAARTMQYVGLYRIECDGLVQQVTLSVGAGATTVASENTEHSRAIIPYPKRRRAEVLDADKAAAAANAVERGYVDKIRRPGVPLR